MNDSTFTFATVLNCMDGRVQLPVIETVRTVFNVDYVDSITEAGIVRFLSMEVDSIETNAALASIRISVEKHNSHSIAVAAHQECAGNPCADTMQKEQLQSAVSFLKGQFPNCKIIGLWLDNDWQSQILIPE